MNKIIFLFAPQKKSFKKKINKNKFIYFLNFACIAMRIFYFLCLNFYFNVKKN
jgi:hypothetical protein